MVNYAFERGDDAAKEFGEFATRDQDIVDLEKDLEAIAFLRKLFLIGLRRFEVESIIDGYGDLAGDALHELEADGRDALWDEAAKTHRAQAVLRGGEREDG